MKNKAILVSQYEMRLPIQYFITYLHHNAGKTTRSQPIETSMHLLTCLTFVLMIISLPRLIWQYLLVFVLQLFNKRSSANKVSP